MRPALTGRPTLVLRLAAVLGLAFFAVETFSVWSHHLAPSRHHAIGAAWLTTAGMTVSLLTWLGAITLVSRYLRAQARAWNALQGAREELEATVAERTAALRQTESHLRAIFQESPAGISLMRLDGTVLESNPTFERIMGYGEGRSAGTRVACNRALIAALLESPGDHLRMEKSFVRPDGSPVCADLGVSMVRGAAGEPDFVVARVRDITEQKEAEARLRAAEAEQRAVFAAMTDLILVLDQDGRFVKIPPTSTSVRYRPVEELLGRRVDEIIQGEMGVAIQEVIRETLRSGETQHLEYTMDVAGEEGRFSAVVSPMANGQVVWVARDVTERTRAERALREKDARFRSLMRNAQDIVAVLGADGSMLFATHSAEVLLGYPRAELNGRQIAELIHPDDAPDAARALERCIREPGNAHRVAARVRHADGSWRVHEAVATSLIDDPAVRGVVLNTRDITDRTAAEEALAENVRWISALFDNAADGISVHDRDGKVLRVNDRFCAMLGYTREELLNLEVAALNVRFTPERISARLDAMAPDTPVTAELLLRHRDGSEIPVEVRFTRVERSGQPVLLALVRDVSERKRMEEQLRQAQKMEAVGTLAGGVAHDFNNQLTAILGFSMLARIAPERGADLHGYLEEIEKAARRSAALTTQLLAFSRKQVLQPKVLDLNTVVRSTDTMLRRLMTRDIELVSLMDSPVGTVNVDPTQMEQVLINLVLNARDAMPGGGRLLVQTGNADIDAPLECPHCPVPAGRYVSLSVSDEGHGMDAAVLERIFEPFFTTKEQGKGTGLGLATVYGIVQQSGGYVCVASEPGLGSTFTIYLPRVDEPADVGAPRLPASHEPCRATILLAEDEPAVRSLARRILQRRGYVVLEAENGEMALRLWRDNPGRIDLVVTDLMMPLMGGRELVHEIEAEGAEIRVVYMSGFSHDAPPELSDPSRVAFVAKPFAPEVLAEVVHDLLTHAAQPA